MGEMSKVGAALVKKAKRRLDEQAEKDRNGIIFVENNESANALLNDLERFPHAFLLACLMDRQMKTEDVWTIPLKIKEELDSFYMKDLKNYSLEYYKKIFKEKKMHRFQEMMAEIFYDGVKKICEKYEGDASKIWEGTPSSAKVVCSFLEFKGVGIKIATMAANILATRYKIDFADKYGIDISPDVHVIRVMGRLGLVPEKAKKELVMYKARELNPDFPGIIDLLLWEVGKDYCSPHNPRCNECNINDICEYCNKN